MSVNETCSEQCPLPEHWPHTRSLESPGTLGAVATAEDRHPGGDSIVRSVSWTVKQRPNECVLQLRLVNSGKQN